MATDLDPELLERVPPRDILAEQSALGACLMSPLACAEVLAASAAEAYYQPRHVTIYRAIAALFSQKQPVDQITVGKYLADQGELARIGGAVYLYELVQAVPTAANGEYYAEIVQDRGLRRALIELGNRLTQMGYSPDGATSELIERAVAMCRELRDRTSDDDDLPTEDILDFVEHQETYDWIVPGLLERMDRMILTAGEGGGKSVMLRQIAITLAGGIHPFETWKTIDPIKVMVLDCENGEAASRRKYKPLLAAADSLERPIRRGQFHIRCRPEGLDLTRPQDRSWVMRRVEEFKPELLVIGPIYRLHAGDPNSEELARKVSVVLDEARATAGAAVFMEAHAPHHNGFGQHRALRPVGSSLWMRWPEFGFGLRPVEDEKSAEDGDGARGRRFLPWRGMRDERNWPRFVRQGEKWPWISYKPIDADMYGNSQTGAIW
ncbi:DnaB-like helicase N-terminal domain-containing protein [Streptomyces violascens]|uniref:DnaB-like helicase N-terminal domain-containing protein n=1 Tax=Streptomyces violascens TaxID=67381 RepID=UPI0036A7A587